MAFSKIIFNGTTQIDLTQDTVNANNLISPNTAHDAAGLPVTGTASGGDDYPTFTITFDSDWEEVQSITCDKTLNECFDIYDLNDGTCPAFVVSTNGTEEYTGMAWGYEETSVSMTFTLLPDFSADIYYGRYEITTSMPFPSSYPESVTITQNGSYDPTDFDYRPIWGITVNVPPTAPSLQSKSVSYTPSETAQSQTITADSGYDGLDEVSVSVGAISPTYVGTGIARKSSTDLTASGATVTAPAGYYESSATKTVASGTEGIPTATKGTVSNHAVSVTPSVTNTAGYISGGTKTGTAVSVSASELVSGTLTISSSGTKDVTNYASASVAAGSEGTPTATKGAVSNHSVSVTPSVTNTAGYISGSTKTGTAVTVSASELVSGSETKDANGTYDVTNLASLVVSIPFQTIYTGSTAPSSSTGSNGDVYIQTA